MTLTLPSVGDGVRDEFGRHVGADAAELAPGHGSHPPGVEHQRLARGQYEIRRGRTTERHPAGEVVRGVSG